LRDLVRRCIDVARMSRALFQSSAPRTLLWALLLTRCAAQQPAAPAAPPAVLAPPVAVSTPPAAAPVAPPGAGEPGTPLVASPPPEASPLPKEPPPEEPEPTVAAQVEFEPAYKTFQRPRSAGPVFAAGEDEALARWNLGGTSDPNFISNRASFHPGSRVVVDTELVAGQLPAKSGPGLTQRGLLAQSRSRGYWPLRICYEDALRRDAKLSGETRVLVSIARSGRVTRAQVLRTALDEEAGRCLSLAIENLRYEPGPAAGLVAAELSVKFWRGDAPLPATGPAPGKLFANPGRLEASVITAAFEPALQKVERCYARGLVRDPGLWGRLGLRIDLTSDGTIESVHEDESRFPDPEVSACVVSEVTALTFPAPAGGSLSFVQAFRLGAPPAPPAPPAP